MAELQQLYLIRILFYLSNVAVSHLVNYVFNAKKHDSKPLRHAVVGDSIADENT